ncbi:MAG TPA: hypothetical protein VFL59_06655 [Candidatus Nanopelagicales bacterium]|nr:hypothetical protein [Candidatus Nanopelagicales bacterium]
MTVSWTPPEDHGTFGIGHYVVQVYSGNSVDPAQAPYGDPVSSTATTQVMPPSGDPWLFDPNFSYAVTVRTVENEARGWGGTSEAVPFQAPRS